MHRRGISDTYAIVTQANWIHAIPLSAGGFAVAITASTSTAFAVYFGVYANNGAAVRASASINNTTLLQNGVRCAQLSDGSVVVAIASSSANQALGIATFTAAGVAALAYTVIDNTTGVGASPELATVAGYFAVGVQLASGSANAKAYVFNNAGVVQGASLLFTQASSGVAPFFKLCTDGTYFWIICQPTGGGLWVARVPTTGGANAVTTVFPAIAYPGGSDFFIERDCLVLCVNSTIYALAIRADGTVAMQWASTTPTALNASAYSHTFKPAGDFTALVFSPADGTNAAKFRVWRYLDAVIAGVSQSGVAAGAAGTLVVVTTGPASLQINPLPGLALRPFDHQSGAPNMVGNKGYVLPNSVILKGY